MTTSQNMEKEIEVLLQEVSYDTDDEDFNPNREPVIAFSDALGVAKAAHSLGEKAMLERVQEAIKPCLDYCREQNGREDCKNCGLSDGLLKELE